MATEKSVLVPGKIRRYRANLIGANLTGAVLRAANLTGANLTGANLTDAYFSLADLSEDELNDVILPYLNMRGLTLRGAIVSGFSKDRAVLSGIGLREANLKGAIGVTLEELEKQAVSLEGATMPDGSIHP